MTKDTVQIKTTSTEEITICDGCGRECLDGVMYKPADEVRFEVDGEQKWDNDPLHFCSEECVDSVRATGGVREPSESSPIDTLRGAWNRLWRPYGNVERDRWANRDVVEWGLVIGLIPGVGPLAQWEHAEEMGCDKEHQATLISFIWQATWILTVAWLVTGGAA